MTRGLMPSVFLRSAHNILQTEGDIEEATELAPVPIPPPPEELPLPGDFVKGFKKIVKAVTSGSECLGCGDIIHAGACCAAYRTRNTKSFVHVRRFHEACMILMPMDTRHDDIRVCIDLQSKAYAADSEEPAVLTRCLALLQGG